MNKQTIKVGDLLYQKVEFYTSIKGTLRAVKHYLWRIDHQESESKLFLLKGIEIDTGMSGGYTNISYKWIKERKENLQFLLEETSGVRGYDTIEYWKKVKKNDKDLFDKIEDILDQQIQVVTDKYLEMKDMFLKGEIFKNGN